MTLTQPRPAEPVAAHRLATTFSVHNPGGLARKVPLAFGVPLPQGAATDPRQVELYDADGARIPHQAQPLAHWPNGSLRWILLDALASELRPGVSTWMLMVRDGSSTQESDHGRAQNGSPTTAAHPSEIFPAFNFSVPTLPRETCRDEQTQRATGGALPPAESSHSLSDSAIEAEPLPLDPTDPCARLQLDLALTTRFGRRVLPRFERRTVEARGPLRTTIALDGRFPWTGLRLHARLSHYPSSRLVKLEVRLHNPRRARHRGGLWDLGDAGSILFRAFHVEVHPRARGKDRKAPVDWTVHPNQAWRRDEAGCVEIRQHSSGGPAGDSPNHIDRHGRLPARAEGFHVRTATETTTGFRASPILSVQHEQGRVTAALPEFWQQFPKSLESHAGTLRIGLFPDRTNLSAASGTRRFTTESRRHEEDINRADELSLGTSQLQPAIARRSASGPSDSSPFSASPCLRGESLGSRPLHELQGGEQKTHTLWISLDDDPTTVAWVHAPIRVTFPAEWHEAAASPAYVVPVDHARDGRLIEYLRAALAGERSLSVRRDRIDEYGWRNYGEVPADHEQEHYPGGEPVISHYNNQFDLIFGAILQLCRTEDPRWFDLFDPLARHVLDIDLYHTTKDRPAYSGGLFWHTDHYRTAGTGTHRAYSRHNKPKGRDYGGGPGNEHNYTTGLLQYHYLTGNPDARAAVLMLADWVIAMDDGRQSLFGLVNDRPTGLATATADPDFHGPGRGAGNSLNALTDAWILTRDPRYAAAAERIIRRVVHPEDDIDSLDLLNAELRWSYTVFLVALVKWLDEKSAAGERDDISAYGRASLLHYARWMAANERPYFDRREELEYPTATWPAQELRKANVLRLAARHAEGPERTQFLERADQLAHRAWTDLESFDTRHTARCLSLVMTEGAREAWLRKWHAKDDSPLPRRGGEGPGVRGPSHDAQPPTRWPPRESFVPQKTLVRQQLKSPATAARIALKLFDPLVWPEAINKLRRHL